MTRSLLEVWACWRGRRRRMMMMLSVSKMPEHHHWGPVSLCLLKKLFWQVSNPQDSPSVVCIIQGSYKEIWDGSTANLNGVSKSQWPCRLICRGHISLFDRLVGPIEYLCLQQTLQADNMPCPTWFLNLDIEEQPSGIWHISWWKSHQCHHWAAEPQKEHKCTIYHPADTTCLDRMFIVHILSQYWFLKGR